jgi:hypothetical protein
MRQSQVQMADKIYLLTGWLPRLRVLATIQKAIPKRMPPIGLLKVKTKVYKKTRQILIVEMLSCDISPDITIKFITFRLFILLLLVDCLRFKIDGINQFSLQNDRTLALV